MSRFPLIRQLQPRHRAAMAQHLLQLSAADRRLRFGMALSDAQVADYVARVDFGRDRLLGIFDADLALSGLAHLAYPAPLRRLGLAELGVSVRPAARGRGLGRLLFGRAALLAGNDGARTLLIHALHDNPAMLRLARQAGAHVHGSGGEQQARLMLPAANFKSRARAWLAERAGRLDYGLKTEAGRARAALGLVQEVREAVRRVGDSAGS